jgi:Fe-S oxidoreductase
METALFPGCVLGVFYPDLVRGIEGLMWESDVNVRSLGRFDCCGFPALSQGNLKTFEQKKRYNEARMRESGVRTLVLPCATGFMAMRAHYTPDVAYEDLGTWLQNQDREWEILHPDVLKASEGVWLFHRPCHQPKRDESRGWLGALARSSSIRMTAREETDCCGFGGLFSIGFPILSRAILRDRQDTWRSQGVGGIITDCPGCYMQFREAGTLPVLFFSEVFCRPAGPAEVP